MRAEEGLLARQKEEWRALVFRASSRRRRDLVGSALSPGGIFFGLPAEAPRADLTSFSPLGVLGGMGALFGSRAEIMPEPTTLAGILRVWAGPSWPAVSG